MTATRPGSILLAAVLSLPAASSGERAAPQGFVDASPRDVSWQPHPAVQGGEFAVLLGRPDAEGPLVMRIRFPANARILPHTHPDERTYTVLSGEWQLGFGTRFDAARMKSYPAGSFYRLPAGAAHFQATGAEGALVQIESIGPTSTDFIAPPAQPR